MKTHSFRLLKDDKDIEEILGSMEGKKKAEFIRSALRFYINYGNSIENIEKKIEEIAAILKSGAISFSDENKRSTEMNLKNETNSILCESIQSLLEL